MKTLWTYLHGAPVRRLRIGADGHHVVLDDPDGGALLLDLTGRPVVGSRLPAAADLVTTASGRRGTSDGVRLTLTPDGIGLDEAELDGPVTAIVTTPDGSVVVAGTERGTVYGLRPRLAEDEAPASPGDARSAFEGGRALAAAGEHRAAIGLLQRAAEDAGLRSRALYLAGECFQHMGAESAAAIAYEQAALSGPGDDDKRLLYDNARALRDQGRHTEAADRLETLLAWDATYEDAWKLLADCRTRAASATPGVDPSGTVSSPPEVLVRDLEARGLLGNSDSRLAAYDALFYVQFDHTGVHDSAKKRMELVQLLTAVGDLSAVATSLDVGSGTLRYPQVLDRFGVRSYGIDLSDAGIHSCVDERWASRFAVADGTAMPFRDGSFDLVTCMMGTVNHLSAAQRARFLAESFRTLRPGGLLVVSAWDPQCRFQTFLSFYSPAEMAQLRGQLTEREPLRAECAAAGFGEVRTTPFCTFPDWLVTGAGPGTDADHLARLADLDRDRAAHDPTAPGQMFLLSARR
ncbi:methyltransferase domain-containing protein [Streptomyces sp. NPDC058471]|uniref:methyltransferase domain-containing protein n=1 Tax=Streptomyces sp. NPDC058471 TaxID=3346516 RepID=UPI003666DB92